MKTSTNKSKLLTALLIISILLNLTLASLTISLTTTNNNNQEQAQQQKEVFEVTNILYESTDNFYLDPHEIGIEFSNGSWAVANLTTNEYTFQPINLGDWDYTFNSLNSKYPLKDFENCIKTYASIINNGSY